MTSGYSTFSKTVSTGIRLKLWKMNPMCLPRKSAASVPSSEPTSIPATRSCPLEGLSRQPTRFSSVVLPLPEGPTKETKAPDGIEKLSPLNAEVMISPVR